MGFGPALGVQFSQVGGRFDPAETVIVATGGTGGVDYNSIQEAIDSITTATEANPFAILVFPGIYNEDLDFTGKPFISLIGMGTVVAPVIVRSAGGDTLTLANTGTTDNMGFSCHGVRFESQFGRVINIPAGANRLTHVFLGCWVSCDISVTPDEMIRNNGHHLVFWSGKMKYDFTGAGGMAPGHFMINCVGAAELYLHSNHLEMNVADPNNDIFGVYMAAGDITRFQVEGNELRVEADNVAFAANAIGIFAGGEGADKHCRGNTIRVFSSGNGDLYGYFLESNTGNAMHSQGNRVYVDGGANNYFAHTGLAGHDIFYTHYDQVHAADHIVGAGAYTGQYSPMEGYHHGTLSVTAPRLNLNDYLPGLVLANEDDYDPVGLGNTSLLALTANGNFNITGIAAPTDSGWGDDQGRLLAVVNVGGQNILTLTDEDAASAAPNRFSLGEDMKLPAGAGCLLMYYTLASRWVCIGYWSDLPDYIKIIDQKDNGTNGGTFNAGAWRTRDLTLEVWDTGGHAGLASNQITLQPGTYECRISAPAYKVGQHKIKLRNITDGADEIIGSSEVTVIVGAVQTRSFLSGRFVITAAKTFEVQHWGTVNAANTGFGAPVTAGVVEIYTIAEFWKVA